MAVLGAILGDIAGSRFEFKRPFWLDIQNCELFTKDCEFTDDTVMTLAVKKAVITRADLVKTMKEIGRHYPDCGYGGKFRRWILGEDTKPYNSYGNGSAMRVSFIGEYFNRLEDVVREAGKTAAVTHNHPEGIKGAVATAVCIWMAKNGKTKDEIYDYVMKQYPAETYEYSIDKDLNYLRKHYRWNETCMGSVPAAMRCFYESSSFDGFMRNLFQLNCDCDTLGAIGGAVAEEFYHGIGFDGEEILRRYLDDRLWEIWEL